MNRIVTSVVTDAHAYTHSDSPWIIGEHKSAYGKLMHYLSGGGMTTFGRTVTQEETKSRHRRFLVWAAVFGVLWVVFYLA